MVLYICRYRVKVEAFDGKDSVIFVLSDAIVRKYLKIPCQNLIRKQEVVIREHILCFVLYVFIKILSGNNVNILYYCS